jgi:hypothetical protein
LLACETSITPEVRGCCGFPLRSSVRSKRIELSLLLRNLLHTLTIRNPEFPFAEPTPYFLPTIDRMLARTVSHAGAFGFKPSK